MPYVEIVMLNVQFAQDEILLWTRLSKISSYLFRSVRDFLVLTFTGRSQRSGRPIMDESEVSSVDCSQRVPHLEKEMDQIRRVMDEMRENMRRANPVEDLVHRTNSPFTTLINGHPLPLKFKMPSLDSYDGTRDPFDHIATFKTTMHLQGVPDEIICRAFPTTLKGPARVWFSKIPPNSVSSFEVPLKC